MLCCSVFYTSFYKREQRRMNAANKVKADGLNPRFPVSDSGADANSRIRRSVKAIGLQLDHGIFPEVFNGGLVAPSVSAIPQSMGAEKSHVRAETSANTTDGSWASGASPPREGPAAPWTSGEASPVKRTDVRSLCANDLAAVHAAYPGTHVWSSNDGFWLLTESLVVPGLKRAAVFLTAVHWSFASVKAWGFWRNTPVSVQWIGPRHTNFPDGSVCAFEREDRTWVFGESLVVLLDLYSVWAVRHLHLELFGHWPGPQSVPHPYERRLELQPHELCGCGSAQRYGECCLSRDAARDLVRGAVSFAMYFAGGVREPPPSLGKVALRAAEPPALSTLKWQ